MRTPSRASTALLVLALAAPLTAQESTSPSTYSRNKLEATGKLSRKGDCQILTDKDGKKHALAGDLSAFRDGETLLVRGTRGEVSLCTDGPAIQVVDAQAAPAETAAATPKEKGMKNTVVRGKALPKPGKKVTVRGVLTDEGVECQALRGDDGILYTLAGRIEGYEVGDRVRVQGTIAEVSTCQQGTTIGVTKIQKDQKKE
ncbi:MAG TPA: DUF5818 domain-containing protein [Thermoanaerobaculia bacterium]|nr:DUF5818 domain-containing protein [Thermoanaerobaculia bacterium]